MRCIYKFKARAKCPVDPSKTDVYKFRVVSPGLIPVERILEFLEKNAGENAIFQEELTEKCALALGAAVTSVGWHSGVKVECSA